MNIIKVPQCYHEFLGVSNTHFDDEIFDILNPASFIIQSMAWPEIATPLKAAVEETVKPWELSIWHDTYMETWWEGIVQDSDDYWEDIEQNFDDLGDDETGL